MKTKKITAAGLLTAALLSGGGTCQSPIDPTAKALLVSRRGAATFTVYSTFVRSESSIHDVEAGKRLVEFVEKDGIGKATLSEQKVSITGKWGMNESKMWRESVEALSKHVKANPITTQYAMLSEYIIGRGEVLGVHLYVLDSDGTPAFGVLANSHDRRFSSRRPKTVSDANAVLQAILHDELGATK